MFKKKPALWLAVGLTLIFLVLAVLQIGFIESLELATYDWRMGFRAGDAGSKVDIALVDIDDDSIDRLGRWPWPRALIAKMIDKLQGYGASIIGLNLIFSEKQKDEGLEKVKELKAAFVAEFPRLNLPGADRFLKKIDEAQNSLDNDEILRRTIAQSGKVVLPVFFPQAGSTPRADPNLPQNLVKNGFVQVQGDPLQYMRGAMKIAAPIDSFSENALGLGHINIYPDRHDGAIRSETLLVNYKGLAFPSYTLKLALLAKDIPFDTVEVYTPEEGREGLKIGHDFVPTNETFDFHITFNKARVFPHYSFFDVLNDKVQATAFKDKIILIGVSATGVDIPQVTPLDKQMSSSTIAANALQNLLTGGYITRSSGMLIVELLILLVIGAFLALLLPRLKARPGAIASFIVLVLVIAAGTILFMSAGIWLKITYPVLLTAFGYIGVTTTRYFITEVSKDKVEGESAEINRMLGLNFQSQGMLDMAFDKLRRVPVDEGMKDILYNLALDYERKRMFNKAVAVYEYIKEHDEKFRDIDQKIKKLNVASETMIFGLGSGAKSTEDGTLLIDENTKPTLGRYEVLKELGKGAMGIVYMGKDPKIGRVTAIKTIRFTEEYEEEEAKRLKEQFFTEAETAGQLSHPHIVTIYDAGEDHDLSYIAMEYLEGYDLKEHARPENLLSIRDVIRHVADVADALGYAHSKGVVHRDIKPANIMLLKNGIAKVTDFGIARAMASSKTKTGVVKGTPFYMSPEQITGKRVDGRSDIFSLGVVLYELLSGTQPFKADDLTALIYKITSEDPESVIKFNPKVPKAISQIIEKALVKDREHRYQKAEQMAEHLKIVGRKMDEIAARKQNQKAT